MINIETDIQDILKTLNELGIKQKPFIRKSLSMIGREGRKLTRRTINNTAKKSGGLAKSIRYRVSKNNNLIIQPSGGINFMKSYVLQNGLTINSKGKTPLIFQINGKWIRKHSTTIKPKSWFHQATDNYIKSGGARKAFELTLSKEIDRYFQKATK